MAVSESQVRLRLRPDGPAARAVTAALAYAVGARAELGVDRLDELLIAIDLLVASADPPVQVCFDATAAGLDVTVEPVPASRLDGLRATLGGLADRVSEADAAITVSLDA